jgi:putative FmdB family regulatory protein
MPIYEFYCADCHTVYNFLSRTIETKKRPACPRCGRGGLERRVSAFAISKGRKEPAGGEDVPEVDETRLERAMASLASEAGSLDDEDPKGAARFMRRLYETAGLNLGPGMSEALRRMESGEDPEAIEEEMGDVLEEDPFAGAAVEKTGAKRFRRFLPPRIDPELHEL